MSRETELEVIKALAFGVDVEDIANMAEVAVENIRKIQEDAGDEINIRRKELEGYSDAD